MKYLVLAAIRFIYYTLLCLKANVTCLKSVTAGSLGTKNFRYTVMKFQKTKTNLDIRKNFSCNRVVDDWNRLPESAISAPTLLTSKIFS